MGSVVSLMTAADNIGLALGPMLGGALIEAAGHPIAMGGLGLLMAGAVLAIHRGGALHRAASTAS
jgi:predicted MFS family arabinose efflux permease